MLGKLAAFPFKWKCVLDYIDEMTSALKSF